MLSQDIINALKNYTSSMQAPVTFVLQTGEHAKRAELLTFLNQIADISDKINVEERDTNNLLRSAISFAIETDGKDTGIRFFRYTEWTRVQFISAGYAAERRFRD